MPDIGKLRDAANAWAKQEAADIASGKKQVPPRVGTKMPESKEVNFQSVEKEPGATLGQAARARGIAKAQLNQSSSVGNMSHDVPSETDLHGDMAVPKSPETFGSQPKDLGRVTAKVVRGEYGPVSTTRAQPNNPATIEGIVGSTSKGTGFLGRAARSIGGKAGSVLGAYGNVSLGIKAGQALKTMKEGGLVDPMTLDRIPRKAGTRIMTPGGRTHTITKDEEEIQS